MRDVFGDGERSSTRAAHEYRSSRRMRLPDLTTRIVALGMVGLAAVAGTIYGFGWAQAWMPSVVVGSLSVALTVTVVERAIHSEERRREQPLADRAFQQMGLVLRIYVPVLIADYTYTHPEDTESLPRDVVALTDLWLAGRDDEERHRPERRPGEYPALVQAARYLLDSLVAASEHYALVVASRPDVLHQIEISAELVRHARAGFEITDNQRISDRASIEASSIAKSVAAVKGCAVVLGRYAPRWVVATEEQVDRAARWRDDWAERLANERDPSSPRGSAGDNDESRS